MAIIPQIMVQYATMTDQQYMDRAIQLAYESKEPLPCGVVIMKDGEIIAEAYNSQHSDHDVTAHAEMKALRIAGNKLKAKNLEGAIVYCTCEPCSMCASALIYGRISTIYYGMPIADIDHDDKRIKITAEYLAMQSPRPTTVISKFNYEACAKLYHDRLEKMKAINPVSS